MGLFQQKTGIIVVALLLLQSSSNAFTTAPSLSLLSTTTTSSWRSSRSSSLNLLDSSLFGSAGGSDTTGTTSRVCRASELIKSLIEEDKCFSTIAGAKAFSDVCALNIVYEDCYEPQPIVGQLAVKDHMMNKVEQRKGLGDVRLDKISDGDIACGFAWTWITGNEEGLRGTTFIELNDSGEIQYIREIPEPIYKPGDLTLDLLKAVTEGAEVKPPKEFTQRTPTTANEIAKYLFLDVQGGDIDEAIRFYDDDVIYRDFNYEEVLRGPVEVRKFIEDFSFPGITFRPQRFDDGIISSCFTWEVVLDGAPEDATIKGISFYEVNPESGKVVYVRDVPESAIKPPILGKLARQLRPGLGVFQGVKLGSRPGGM